MPKMTYSEIVNRLHGEIEKKHALLVTATGIGITAKCQEFAGSDLLVVDCAARIRMAGFGSLGGNFAFKKANEQLLIQAEEILPIIKKVPVIAGVAAAEPFSDIITFVDKLSEMGFSGIANSPSVGWNDEFNQKNLSKLGIGYDSEVALIKAAHERGLFTVAHCFDASQAAAMASCGADIVIANIGLTSGGLIGAKTVFSMDEAVNAIQKICDAAKEANNSVIVLCHGGPLSTPCNVACALSQLSGVAGFLGESATDRIPME
ncbi:MAG: phosphoenolpyruvate hydrolase family protein, partial [Oscillospiraceae bacterium]